MKLPESLHSNSLYERSRLLGYFSIMKFFQDASHLTAVWKVQASKQVEMKKAAEGMWPETWELVSRELNKLKFLQPRNTAGMLPESYCLRYRQCEPYPWFHTSNLTWIWNLPETVNNCMFLMLASKDPGINPMITRPLRSTMLLGMEQLSKFPLSFKNKDKLKFWDSIRNWTYKLLWLKMKLCKLIQTKISSWTSNIYGMKNNSKDPFTNITIFCLDSLRHLYRQKDMNNHHSINKRSL